MAGEGTDAAAAGYDLVPSTGIGGEVRYGYREINKTRDYVAQVKNLVLAIWPVSRGGTGATTPVDARTNLGICGAITHGVDAPTGGVDGDIYFKHS